MPCTISHHTKSETGTEPNHSIMTIRCIIQNPTGKALERWITGWDDPPDIGCRILFGRNMYKVVDRWYEIVPEQGALVGRGVVTLEKLP